MNIEAIAYHEVGWVGVLRKEAECQPTSIIGRRVSLADSAAISAKTGAVKLEVR